ncbi:MAG: hypothetical protein RMY29_016605 [Nostoc sp. CreGUA01]|nr:hypothetical protein [Nostoc sp. CreGUA01]
MSEIVFSLIEGDEGDEGDEERSLSAGFRRSELRRDEGDEGVGDCHTVYLWNSHGHNFRADYRIPSPQS